MYTELSTILLSYFLVLFFIGFITMGIDKWKAKHYRWRIPEKKLWLIAWLGGATGTWLGMIVFHHKTRHPNFFYGFTLLAIVELIIILALF